MPRRHNAQNSLGNLLRKLRRIAGKKQCEVAELLGVHRETVSRWENDRDKPSIDMLIEFANVVSARDDQLHELIMLERNVQTRFLPWNKMKPLMEQIAEDIAETPFPAYLLDYRGRFWVINEAVADMVNMPFEEIKCLLREYKRISYLDVVFDSQLPFKGKLKNYDNVARQEVARYKYVNMYRRHEKFYQNTLQDAKERFGPEDYRYFKSVWYKLDETMLHELLNGIRTNVTIRNGEREQFYWLHTELIFQLGRDLFTKLWYCPRDWQPVRSIPQPVVCLWDLVDIHDHFEGEWQP